MTRDAFSFVDALAAATRDAPAPKRVYPVREAQLAHLADAFANTHKSRPFTPGDRVHYLAGTGSLKEELKAAVILMFWRDLDFSDAEDRHRLDNADEAEIGLNPHLDCLLAFFDGEQLHFTMGCKELLRHGEGQ